VALRVLHLVGSATSDFLCDLSRLYAGDCLEAIADPERYDPAIAYVTPDRRWRFPAGLDAAALAAAEPMSLADAVARLETEVFDVAVPQMFCPPGMTEYRALLDLVGIPYVGNRPEVMAATMHKARARALVAAAGVAVPEGEVLRPGDRLRLQPPAVVKPASADNSVGVTLVRDCAGWDDALASAITESGEVLVERYVELGREVRCGIVVRDGELVALPLEEYAVDARRPIRGYADKLARDPGGDLELVAKDPSRAWIVDPDDPITAPVWAAAKRCHAALGCRHYSLFDFRIDPAGRPWFLEAGLYNSFARQSVVATMARAAGIDTPELFDLALREVARSDNRLRSG
jgi:D-alanine-D-alanine ligase